METVDDMFLSNLIIAAKRAGRSSASNGLDQIRPASEFQRLLDRERSRCDRTGEEFSVVIFTPSDPRTRSDVLHHLARSLSRRLRRTDDAGWMGVDRLGVLLPCTPAQGAWKVADGTCLGFPAGLPLPVCEVYSYPSGPWQGGDRKLPPLEVGPDSPHRTVQGMEQLFCQALPLWKRILDVVVAGSALVLLSPLLAIVAAAVKLTSPGPVFFRQLRSGLGGSRFFMYKFRSMRVGAEQQRQALQQLNEQDGPAFKIRNDPRVTRLGRFLRRTSIDELPQLWNVLRGEMSLVGPRPLPCHESDACAPWQLRRLDVTPGLTCIWQVRGRSRVSFDDWMRMDIEYTGSRSLLSDLKLLLQTVPAVLARRGAC